MKLLFLCHRLPYPPKRGGKIRPFNMIRHLSRRHEVTVATLAQTGAELAEGRELSQYCHELHIARVSPVGRWGRFARSGLTSYPATFGYFYSPVLAHTVKRLLGARGFDAILVHCSSMGPYVASHRGCRKIMDFGDADSEKWLEYGRTAKWPLSVAFAREGHKVRRYEGWLASQFDVCTVNAPREREVLGAYIAKPIHVIPNGVDLAYFQPSATPRRAAASHRLLFTGNMSYRPNVDAVQHLVADILPRIRREIPSVQLYIVGMDPAPAVRKIADGDRVIVTGRVDDVRPFFSETAVAVAPLRFARGLQNKVLEAMAMRVPVVASRAAFEGIDAVADRDLLVAGDVETFSRAVVKLLREPVSREAYAAAGRACVERNHNWDTLLNRLEQLVTERRENDGISGTSDHIVRMEEAPS